MGLEAFNASALGALIHSGLQARGVEADVFVPCFLKVFVSDVQTSVVENYSCIIGGGLGTYGETTYTEQYFFFHVEDARNPGDVKVVLGLKIRTGTAIADNSVCDPPALGTSTVLSTGVRTDWKDFGTETLIHEDAEYSAFTFDEQSPVDGYWTPPIMPMSWMNELPMWPACRVDGDGVHTGQMTFYAVDVSRGSSIAAPSVDWPAVEAMFVIGDFVELDPYDLDPAFSAGDPVLGGGDIENYSPQYVDNATALTFTFTSISPTSGTTAGGDILECFGTGFTGSHTIKVDGVSCPTFFLSSTWLVCSTPAHAAGVVDVAVANSSGQITRPDAFTYL